MTGKTVDRSLHIGSLEVGSFQAGDGSFFDYAGEQFEPDSDLMILEGCQGETCDCATRYYRWTGRRFQLMLERAVRLPKVCSKRSSHNRY
jgi:hypothetical protein